MKGKVNTAEFLKHIEILGQLSPHRLVSGFRGKETEKEFIKKMISDSQELIEHNEWGVALENLISNLHEIDFKIDTKAIELAKSALEECGLKYEDWRFIEDLNS